MILLNPRFRVFNFTRSAQENDQSEFLKKNCKNYTDLFECICYQEETLKFVENQLSQNSLANSLQPSLDIAHRQRFR